MAEPENWERKTLEKLAFSALQEQRRSRNWGIFFKTLTFAYLTALLLIGMGMIGKGDMTGGGKHTAVVDLHGVIGAGADTDAERVITGLQAAFSDKNTQGIILRINSPGGSPVQAGYINDEIRRLKTLHPKIPIYSVVEDICASGGYYVAVATDKIYVDKASIVGSIGVIMDSFGFTGTMEKLGVERRMLTAGTNKGFLDPFSPSNPEQEVFAREMLGEIHNQFIQVVRQGRGKRLKETPEMFSGLVWSGEKSIQMGLADAVGSAEYVAREIIKEENMMDFTPQDDLAERFAKRLGTASAQSWIAPLATGRLNLH
jgi:protease-4